MRLIVNNEQVLYVMLHASSPVAAMEAIVIYCSLKFWSSIFPWERWEMDQKAGVNPLPLQQQGGKFFKLKRESIQQTRECFLRQKSRQSAG